MKEVLWRFWVLLRSIATVGTVFSFGAFFGWLTYDSYGPVVSGAVTAAGIFLGLALIWVVTGEDPFEFIFPKD